MKQELNTKIYFILKVSLYAFLSFVLLIGIIVFIGKFLNLPLLGIFLFICLCTVPIYFKKKLEEFLQNLYHWNLIIILLSLLCINQIVMIMVQNLK